MNHRGSKAYRFDTHILYSCFVYNTRDRINHKTVLCAVDCFCHSARYTLHYHNAAYATENWNKENARTHASQSCDRSITVTIGTQKRQRRRRRRTVIVSYECIIESRAVLNGWTPRARADELLNSSFASTYAIRLKLKKRTVSETMTKKKMILSGLSPTRYNYRWTRSHMRRNTRRVYYYLSIASVRCF